jgi:hypothetical protein
LERSIAAMRSLMLFFLRGGVIAEESDSESLAEAY